MNRLRFFSCAPPAIGIGLGLWVCLVTATGIAAKPEGAVAGAGSADALPSAKEVAREVDRLILAELAKTHASVTPPAKPEDFLRRVTFDLAGTAPTPRDVTLFGLDPDPAKREKTIDRLLASPDFAKNWGQYWREVIYSRATDPRSRISQPKFEDWIVSQFEANQGWDKIATALLTATGDVLESGQTALIFAQGADANEIASETSRIFLGIQLQCANCHDHPTDKWKREQFHQLAAFFPRIRLQPKLNATPRSFEIASLDQAGGGGGPGAERFRELFQNPEKFMQFADRDKDGKITKAEVPQEGVRRLFDRILTQADTDKDGALTLKELQGLPRPDNQPGRGSAEHFMPDLENPQDQGRKIDPLFFVNNAQPGVGLSDQQRRQAIADYITSPENPWFARAFVNRIWAEMLGEGFYMPVDDMGPERSANFPQVLDALSAGFIAHHYDMKWLFRTIANTDAYQRSIKARSAAQTALACAAPAPTRLRSDQLFDALMQVLGTSAPRAGRPQAPGNLYAGDRSPRGQFNRIFGFDPSTPPDEIIGTLPQALFLMNNPTVNNLIKAGGQTRLARLLSDFPENEDAVTELYLLVLAREPSDRERKITQEYITSVGNRSEAFEDLMWSLLNSSEFQTKR
jgi:hypothetical protein